MTRRHLIRAASLVALVASWLLVWAPADAYAQDALTRAKGHYASAEYEEALQLLQTLKGRSSNTEAATYQVFCLVALDRRDEARAVIETIVRADPMFRPAEDGAAPRMRSFFDDVRKSLLPDLARQAYLRAKTAYDRKDFPPALTEFDRAIALIDDLGGTQLADLRIIARGFRDLTWTAMTQPDPKFGVSAGGAGGTARPTEPAIYTPQHADVAPPISLSRDLPRWRPGFFELNRTFTGEVQLVISTEGRVLTASIVKSVHARYDSALSEAAMNWTFKPATKNGVPVNYLYTMTVSVLR